MDRNFPRTRSTDPEYRRRTRLLLLVTLTFALVGLCTVRPHVVRAAFERMESLMGRKTEGAHPVPGRNPRPASRPNSGI